MATTQRFIHVHIFTRAVIRHNFDIQDVHILDRDSRWFERGVKEAIGVRHEQPSLNRSGGVRVKLSHGWDRVIREIPRRMASSPVNIPTDRKSSQGPSQPSWRSQVAVATLVALNQVCLDDQNKNYSSFIKVTAPIPNLFIRMVFMTGLLFQVLSKTLLKNQFLRKLLKSISSARLINFNTCICMGG